MTVIISGDTGIDTVAPNTVGNGQLIDGSVQLAKLGFTPPFTKEWVSAELSFTRGTHKDVTHPLGVRPKSINVLYKCVVAELGYAVGDILPRGQYQDNSAAASGFISRYVGTNTIKLSFGTNGLYVPTNNGIGAPTGMTDANWRLILEVYA